MVRSAFGVDSNTQTRSKHTCQKLAREPAGRHRTLRTHPAAASWLGDGDSSLFRWGQRASSHKAAVWAELARSHFVCTNSTRQVFQ